MNLFDLKRPLIKKGKKRLGKGQGTGQGGTAGRGHKGQKARAGGKVPIWFEGGQMPLQRRLPKRGFKNRFRVEYRVVNLDRFQDLSETDFDVEKMEKIGLVRSVSKNAVAPVKILAGGKENFNKAITVRANAFSEEAKAIIEKNGGKAEIV